MLNEKQRKEKRKACGILGRYGDLLGNLRDCSGSCGGKRDRKLADNRLMMRSGSRYTVRPRILLLKLKIIRIISKKIVFFTNFGITLRSLTIGATTTSTRLIVLLLSDRRGSLKDLSGRRTLSVHKNTISPWATQRRCRSSCQDGELVCTGKSLRPRGRHSPVGSMTINELVRLES